MSQPPEPVPSPGRSSRPCCPLGQREQHTFPHSQGSHSCCPQGLSPCTASAQLLNSSLLWQTIANCPSWARGQQTRFALPARAKHTQNAKAGPLQLFHILIHVGFLEQLMHDLMHLQRAYPTCFHADMSAGPVVQLQISRMKIINTYC